MIYDHYAMRRQHCYRSAVEPHFRQLEKEFHGSGLVPQGRREQRAQHPKESGFYQKQRSWTDLKEKGTTIKCTNEETSLTHSIRGVQCSTYMCCAWSST